MSGPPRSPSRSLAGLGAQLRFVARRDRVRGPVWVVAIVGIVLASAASVLALYPTPADLVAYARLAQANVAFKALTGPGFGLDDPTDGAVVMNETSLYTYVAVALMAIFLVVRHTRAEEDTARAELVRAAPVGRGAPLAAAVVWVSGLVAVIGVGLAAGLLLLGLPAGGSIAFGAANVAIGLVFVGVAAVCAQVASSGRAASAMAGAVLGIAFLLRAVGDIGHGALTWASPVGVAQAIRPFADERWWVLVPLAVITGALLVGAGVLLARRDFGAGFVRQRPGPANAAPTLASPLALAVRLQRVTVFGWAIGLVVMGASFGLVAEEAEEFAEGNEAIAEMLALAGAADLTEAFLATTMLMLALMTSGFTVSSVLRMRTEERAGRVEAILATPVDRRTWWASHLVVAVAGSVVLTALAGLAVGLSVAVQSGDWSRVVPLLGAALVWSIPLLVLAALTAALVGAVPRAWGLAWAAVAWCALVGLLAETLDLPQRARNASPFAHVPAVPAASLTVTPLLAQLVVAATLAAVGAFGIARRDL